MSKHYTFQGFKKILQTKFRQLLTANSNRLVGDFCHLNNKSTRKYIVSTVFIFSLQSSIGFAEINNTVISEPTKLDNGILKFNIYEACNALATGPGLKVCNIISKTTGVRLTVTYGSDAVQKKYMYYDTETGSGKWGLNGSRLFSPIISSTHNIVWADIFGCNTGLKTSLNKDTYYIDNTNTASIDEYYFGCENTGFRQINILGKTIFMQADREGQPPGYAVSNIYVASTLTKITPILITDANTLLAYYRSNLDTVYRLQGTIGKTFRPMAARLYSAILGIVKMMSSENEENPLSGTNSNISKLPITHDSIREQSRLIMVLAEVIVAMIKDEYGDTTVPEIKNYIDSLLPLSSELRLAFGWETGVAGKGSKVIASISTVIEESLKSFHEAVIFYNLKDNKHQGAFNELVFRNIVLKKAVLAREQGDAGAMKEVIAFQTSWNSQAWQEFMTNFLKDPKNKYLTASFKTLLAAVSSLQDFKTDDNNNKLPFLGLGLSTVEIK